MSVDLPLVLLVSVGTVDVLDVYRFFFAVPVPNWCAARTVFIPDGVLLILFVSLKPFYCLPFTPSV